MPQPYDILRIMGENLVRDLVSRIWRDIGNSELVDLKVHPPDDDEAVRPLTFRASDVMCCYDSWLLIGQNGGRLVRYAMWQTDDCVLIQQLYV